MNKLVILVACTLLSLTSCNRRPPTYEEGHNCKIGHFIYRVGSSMWSPVLLSDLDSLIMPKAAFLCVAVKISNADTNPHAVPTLSAVDETGAEHKPSDLPYPLQLDPDTNVNPGVSATGVIIFDVPKNREYQLKITDRGKATYIKLRAQDNTS